MASFAVVIGIDEYWDAASSLDGPVADALAVRRWLVDPRGGGVPDDDDHLKLLLAPTAKSRKLVLPGHRSPAPPEADAIEEALRSVKLASRLEAGRFYFYFSGHGIAPEQHVGQADALCVKGFSPQWANRALLVASILEYALEFECREQLFFIDGCRNLALPPGRKVVPQPLSAVDATDRIYPPPQQFLFLATTPGDLAYEVGAAGARRAAFTQALLEGLAGAGSAKVWDPSRRCYLVRASRLFDYVVGRVARIVGEGPDARGQLPRRAGEQGAKEGSDPVLARLDEKAVAPIPLSVRWDVTATGARPPATAIVIDRDGYTQDDWQTQVTATGWPASFELPPREYTLMAVAPNHKSEREFWSIELYDADHPPVDVALTPSDEPEPALRAPAGPGIEVSRPGELTVTCADPLAEIELADASGARFETGQGRVTVRACPGFYRARLIEEGIAAWQLIRLRSGETKTVDLPAPAFDPTAVAKSVISGAAAAGLGAVALAPLEAAGAPAAPLPASRSTGTLLAMTGSIGGPGPAPFAPRRAGGGLRAGGPRAGLIRGGGGGAAGGAPGAVQILVGDDTANAATGASRIKGLELRWRKRSGAEPGAPAAGEPALPLATQPGLAQADIAASEPGQYWLDLAFACGDRIAVASASFVNRLTRVVVHWNARGRGRVYQYALPLDGDPGVDFAPEEIRRQELVARHVRSGRLDLASERSGSRSPAEKSPTEACLSGFAHLRRGNRAEADEVAAHLIEVCPQLSDGLVLRAECAPGGGTGAAARPFWEEALARGIPILDDALERQYAAVKWLRFDTPEAAALRDAYAKRLRGTLWTTLSYPAADPSAP